MRPNQPNTAEAEALLMYLEDGSSSAVFFDPQYREVLNYLRYGNEGARQKERARLPQMESALIERLLGQIERVLAPSGHLFWWIDKFILGEGLHLAYLKAWKQLAVVDLIVWDKTKLGQGYRSRRRCEYLLVVQKKPKRARGIWTDRGIPDVWTQPANTKRHPHAKPVALSERLIGCVTQPGDTVVDPCAGAYGVLEACGRVEERTFYGADVVPYNMEEAENTPEAPAESDSERAEAQKGLKSAQMRLGIGL